MIATYGEQTAQAAFTPEEESVCMFGAWAGNSLKAALPQIHMNLSSKCDDYSHDDESKHHRKTPRICGFYLWLLQQREEDRNSDWAAKKRFKFPPKLLIYLKISSQNTTEQVGIAAAHPGRLLWVGSSSRIQVPAVPLLVHRNKRLKKEELVLKSSSKTLLDRRVFLNHYSADLIVATQN